MSTTFTKIFGRTDSGREIEVVGHEPSTDVLQLQLADFQLTSPLQALDVLNVSGILTAESDAQLKQSLFVSYDQSAESYRLSADASELSHTGDLKAGGSLKALGGDLLVGADGAATFSVLNDGSLWTESSGRIQGLFASGKDSTDNYALVVTQADDMTGADVRIKSDLFVERAADFSVDVTAGGHLAANATAAVSQDLSAGKDSADAYAFQVVQDDSMAAAEVRLKAPLNAEAAAEFDAAVGIDGDLRIGTGDTSEFTVAADGEVFTSKSVNADGLLSAGYSLKVRPNEGGANHIANTGEMALSVPFPSQFDGNGFAMVDADDITSTRGLKLARKLEVGMDAWLKAALLADGAITLGSENAGKDVEIRSDLLINEDLHVLGAAAGIGNPENWGVVFDTKLRIGGDDQNPAFAVDTAGAISSLSTMDVAGQVDLAATQVQTNVRGGLDVAEGVALAAAGIQTRARGDFKVDEDSALLGTVQIGPDSAQTITLTAAGNITASEAGSTATFRDVEILGNMTISGEQLIAESETVQLSDSIIELLKDQDASDIKDSGLKSKYNDGASDKWRGAWFNVIGGDGLAAAEVEYIIASDVSEDSVGNMEAANASYTQLRAGKIIAMGDMVAESADFSASLEADGDAQFTETVADEYVLTASKNYDEQNQDYTPEVSLKGNLVVAASRDASGFLDVAGDTVLQGFLEAQKLISAKDGLTVTAGLAQLDAGLTVTAGDTLLQGSLTAELAAGFQAKVTIDKDAADEAALRVGDFSAVGDLLTETGADIVSARQITAGGMIRSWDAVQANGSLRGSYNATTDATNFEVLSTYDGGLGYNTATLRMDGASTFTGDMGVSGDATLGSPTNQEVVNGDASVKIGEGQSSNSIDADGHIGTRRGLKAQASAMVAWDSEAIDNGDGTFSGDYALKIAQPNYQGNTTGDNLFTYKGKTELTGDLDVNGNTGLYGNAGITGSLTVGGDSSLTAMGMQNVFKAEAGFDSGLNLYTPTVAIKGDVSLEAKDQSSGKLDVAGDANIGAVPQWALDTASLGIRSEKAIYAGGTSKLPFLEVSDEFKWGWDSPNNRYHLNCNGNYAAGTDDFSPQADLHGDMVISAGGRAVGILDVAGEVRARSQFYAGFEAGEGYGDGDVHATLDAGQLSLSAGIHAEGGFEINHGGVIHGRDDLSQGSDALQIPVDAADMWTNRTIKVLNADAQDLGEAGTRFRDAFAQRVNTGLLRLAVDEHDGSDAAVVEGSIFYENGKLRAKDGDRLFTLGESDITKFYEAEVTFQEEYTTPQTGAELELRYFHDNSGGDQDSVSTLTQVEFGLSISSEHIILNPMGPHTPMMRSINILDGSPDLEAGENIGQGELSSLREDGKVYRMDAQSDYMCYGQVVESEVQGPMSSTPQAMVMDGMQALIRVDLASVGGDYAAPNMPGRGTKMYISASEPGSLTTYDVISQVPGAYVTEIGQVMASFPWQEDDGNGNMVTVAVMVQITVGKHFHYKN